MNSRSSRGHTIFRLVCEVTPKVTQGHRDDDDALANSLLADNSATVSSPLSLSLERKCSKQDKVMKMKIEIKREFQFLLLLFVFIYLQVTTTTYLNIVDLAGSSNDHIKHSHSAIRVKESGLRIKSRCCLSI
jgi:hypothetical protein